MEAALPLRGFEENLDVFFREDNSCNELNLKILAYLSPKEIICMGLVNKNLRILTQDDFLWRILFIRDFGYKPSLVASEGSVLDRYKSIVQERRSSLENLRNNDFTLSHLDFSIDKRYRNLQGSELIAISSTHIFFVWKGSSEVRKFDRTSKQTTFFCRPDIAVLGYVLPTLRSIKFHRNELLIEDSAGNIKFFNALDGTFIRSFKMDLGRSWQSEGTLLDNQIANVRIDKERRHFIENYCLNSGQKVQSFEIPDASHIMPYKITSKACFYNNGYKWFKTDLEKETEELYCEFIHKGCDCVITSNKVVLVRPIENQKLEFLDPKNDGIETYFDPKLEGCRLICGDDQVVILLGKEKFVIIFRKTKEIIEKPFSSDISWALHDYLKTSNIAHYNSGCIVVEHVSGAMIFDFNT